jgi:hypothetical protein
MSKKKDKKIETIEVSVLHPRTGAYIKTVKVENIFGDNPADRPNGFFENVGTPGVIVGLDDTNDHDKDDKLYFFTLDAKRSEGKKTQVYVYSGIKSAITGHMRERITG